MDHRPARVVYAVVEELVEVAENSDDMSFKWKSKDLTNSKVAIFNRVVAAQVTSLKVKYQ